MREYRAYTRRESYFNWAFLGNEVSCGEADGQLEAIFAFNYFTLQTCSLAIV